MACATRLIQILKTEQEAINMTFSIVGYDPATGEVGIAVQSKFLAAGSVVPWATAGAGAIAVQSWSNTSYAPKALAMMADGAHPRQILENLIADDEGREFRQVGMVDCRGRAATYTGQECLEWAGGITGENFAAQGNILVGRATVEALADTFIGSQGDLAERLSLALAAGQKAGGDRRGMQSAGLYIAKAGGGYGGFNDRFVDIRVDDHKDPITELRRILILWRLQFYRTKPGNLVPIEGETRNFIYELLAKEGYYNGPRDGWTEAAQKKFEEYCLTENFDERIAPPAMIDKEVLDYLLSADKA
jgi:uncharacterized Ntn-hydrolase superfamily protein